MKNVYFDHDGNVDDLVSLLLLLQMPEVNLTGVGVIDADGYIEGSVPASRKIITRFGHGAQVSVAASNSRAVHQFPKEWRLSSFSFDAFPLLNEHGAPTTPLADKPAHLDMIDKLQNTEGKTDLVMTGPLTDLARALEVDPTIVDKIERLYWMGGTMRTEGNVLEPKHDGTAEWNAYWDPEAVKTVWDADIEIQMVGLESTNQVPLNADVQQHWASLRRYPMMDLIGQGYALVSSYEANSTYYLWDVLTTVASQYPDLIESKDIKGDVLTSGDGAGRTFETDNGRLINLVTSVHGQAFYDKFDELLTGKDE
ncbi:nucleoside hydrolase [Lentilactobacillus otakiensis]|uniref:Inosine/uridine-preferring nucleoside hydrolase n=1 Tax=Lentilactobacillus otakiensis DSM 19908 = JCM 15040 TaxID=1423780 RepID=S4NSZ9_9LACO|nr:nucleoside hydrolase [Lentilactobacillus otakiensis]KRL12061.1 inosine uridine-preferring nucleoside hydrolase [Lentilactobacillus otakiensis DSM 19908 = JCM 15040]MBZ3776550.1 nucleoside hydrolase [Lentilactobacillus otakiensis]MDV3517399.1 nucleoside hydrolase [Lentilactobacillus otakiensis]GAD17098.1 inosine/uridine-preferring nucleoside hydrolase [Lentilactobacillus otakiensis DSM 19908 = JCM 15040]